MIEVSHSGGDVWVVSVQSAVNTKHTVRVSAGDLAELVPGGTAEELLTESFRFLLEREPNTSILRSFDLPLIGQYFPEYKQEIRTRLLRRKA